MLPQRSFVLGGASSGKSLWAEQLTESYGLSMIYLATGQAFDDEGQARIKNHQKRRDHRWQTIEAPLDVGGVLDGLTPENVVLVDCATMWLSNHMLAENKLDQAQNDLREALRRCAAPWVVVSNEVGQGIVPDNALARQFREAQGALNIMLASEATLAVQVIAGLPLVLKGTLP
ncbi:Bifunctional adenosylcobalamin biosynthesis protein CobP [Sulfitobacter noctilucicola]|uniref:Bifunctional adenosylcobalamin biosynthesis protein n=2 Tax=Sulfitobacter noctilucicola TaxID=1342301 RepID=A0A7W6MBW2_9RHOB|nr:bifunctional adenosylcobinamide kinase/adenosylcobinamide-phosphate guanylyltransferase [Sulfitobacter noctilucicola]KIN63259.1 Bifunctional adenosylcobalamin biosynthesis protein CobP [Sulfitobacter noctilucicola]MBB4175221.1 adenosylcobinamide kinase/adenosylcobinamide-phosphate guanylyltransferase [Sulfitobacter noctilucicola]